MRALIVLLIILIQCDLSLADSDQINNDSNFKEKLKQLIDESAPKKKDPLSNKKELSTEEINAASISNELKKLRSEQSSAPTTSGNKANTPIQSTTIKSPGKNR